MAMTSILKRVATQKNIFSKLKCNGFIGSKISDQKRNHGAYYPIDDVLFGLTEEEQQVFMNFFL